MRSPLTSDDFDLYGDALQDDPYPVLERLREQCPVSRSNRYGGHWIVGRHDDMRDVLRDFRTFSSRQPAIGPLASSGDAHADPQPALTNIDPPMHGTYRRLLTPPFSHARVDGLRSHAVRTAHDLLDQIDDGPIEFMRAFALPYTCNLFLELMGVPLDDLPMILELRDAMLHPTLFPAEQRVDRVMVAGQALFTYLAGLVADRPPTATSTDGRPDVLTVLKSAALVDGRSLSDFEIAGIATQVLLAGVDTTATALGNLVARLATDDDARGQVWATPAVTAAAVEEGLRLEPLVYGARLVTETHELAGTTVEAGDVVLLLSGAANRDPRHYDAPESFRVDRPDPEDHLAFGYGVHRCLGIHLARMELVVAVDALRARWASFAIPSGHAPVRHFGSIAGMYRLPLEVSTR